MKNIKILGQYIFIYESDIIIFQASKTYTRFHINKNGNMSIFDVTNNNRPVNFTENSILIDNIVLSKIELVEYLTLNTR